MSEHIELEEEEFDGSFNGQTIRRLIRLLKPYTLWVIGFLSTVMLVSGLDSYFTYLSASLLCTSTGLPSLAALVSEQCG